MASTSSSDPTAAIPEGSETPGTGHGAADTEDRPAQDTGSAEARPDRLLGFFASDSRRDTAACLLLAVGAFLFPWQLSLLGNLPSSIDFLLQYYPNLAFLGRSLRAGDVPLWNPHVFAGTPYLADPQSAVLYLPNWPFLLLLDTADAARAIVVAHFALAAIGAYLYLRTVRLVPAGALVGAVCFGLSEYTITQVAGIPLLVNLAWIPVILLLAERALQRGSPGYAMAAAAAMAMQLFNGWLHGVYITGFALLATYLWHMAVPLLSSRDWRTALRPTGLMALMGISWLALGAALLIPVLEFTGQSNYLMDRGLEQAGGEGYVTVLALLGVGGSEGHGAYLGAVGLLLLLLGAIHGRDRKRVWLYLLLGGFSLLAAFGTKAPLYGYLHQLVPGFQTFHTPGRFMVLYLLSASALAGYGAEALLAGLERRRLLATVAVALALLLPLQYTMTRMFAPEALGQLANNLVNWSDGPFLQAEAARQLLFSGIAATALLAAAASGRLSGRAAYWAALFLLVGDLFSMRYLNGQYFATPATTFQSPPMLSRMVQETGGSDPYRVLGYARNGTLHILSDLPGKLVPELSPPNLSMVYGLEDAQGYNPLQLRRYAEYLAALNGGPQDYHWALVYNFQSPLVDLLNLRYVTLRGDQSRMSNVTLATGLNLETTLPSASALTKKLLASGIQVHSYLGNSTEMKDGQVAARVLVKDSSGETHSFDLRAGLETAEWAHDRPDVLARVQHGRARVSMTWNIPTPVHTYVAEFSFPQPVEIAEISLERVEPDIFIVSPEVAAMPAQPVRRYEEIGSPAGRPGEVTRLYRNNLALPRALLVPGAEMVQSPEAALERLQEEGFDPRKSVVLEGPDGARQGGSEAPGEVRVMSRANESTKLDVRAQSYRFLLLNELSYPGWAAYLDGQRVRVWRANYLFRAVEIPPGDHVVEFRFEPDSLKLGLALSLPAMSFLMAYAVYRFNTRKPRKKESAAND